MDTANRDALVAAVELASTDQDLEAAWDQARAIGHTMVGQLGRRVLARATPGGALADRLQDELLQDTAQHARVEQEALAERARLRALRNAERAALGLPPE